MPRLVTTIPLRYASRDLPAGEAFDASERDAAILRAAGRAIDLVVDEPAAPGGESGPIQRPAARYRRRDLRADE